MKFKSWLIHKLGGITKEESKIRQPNPILEKDKLVGIYAELVLVDNAHLTDEQIENILKEKLSKLIKPQISAIKTEIDTTTFRGVIKVPVKYIHNEEVNYGSAKFSSKI